MNSEDIALQSVVLASMAPKIHSVLTAVAQALGWHDPVQHAVHMLQIDGLFRGVCAQLTLSYVFQERAAAASARIQQENAARQRREDLEMQQLEQNPRRSQHAPPPTFESGDCSLC